MKEILRLNNFENINNKVCYTKVQKLYIKKIELVLIPFTFETNNTFLSIYNFFPSIDL